MEVGNSDKRCREVDEEGRMTGSGGLGKLWILGNSSVSANPGSQGQTLVSRGLRSEWPGCVP